MFVGCRIIQTGAITIIYSYEKPFMKGYKKTGGRGGTSQKAEAEEEGKVKERGQSSSRAKRQLIRLVNTNWVKGRTSFLTLTNRDIPTIQESNRRFKAAMDYWRRYRKFDYLAVPEYQERGSPHYHLLMFNVPYIEQSEITRYWKHGFIKIRAVDQVQNMGRYLAKYMTKEEGLPKDQKRYWGSRSLKKPTVIDIESRPEKIDIESILSMPLGKMVYSVEYDNDYTGKTLYLEYNRYSEFELSKQENKYSTEQSRVRASLMAVTTEQATEQASILL